MRHRYPENNTNAECIEESGGPNTFRDSPKSYSDASKVFTVCYIFEAKQASGKLAVGNVTAGDQSSASTEASYMRPE